MAAAKRFFKNKNIIRRKIMINFKLSLAVLGVSAALMLTGAPAAYAELPEAAAETAKERSAHGQAQRGEMRKKMNERRRAYQELKEKDPAAAERMRAEWRTKMQERHGDNPRFQEMQKRRAEYEKLKETDPAAAEEMRRQWQEKRQKRMEKGGHGRDVSREKRREAYERLKETNPDAAKKMREGWQKKRGDNRGGEGKKRERPAAE
ncbi:MAG: hypothetical protein EA357_06075 [Micavibrio sp.]|nr:MAG: hypothetical protein EA357_06075 [Micavibrio sp.]